MCYRFARPDWGSPMPAATMIVACLVGFRFYGLDGACIAACAVWLLLVVFHAAVVEKVEQERSEDAARATQGAADSLFALQTELPKLLGILVDEMALARKQRAANSSLLLERLATQQDRQSLS